MKECKLIVEPTAEEDIQYIKNSVSQAYGEEDALFLTTLIYTELNKLKNPFLPGTQSQFKQYLKSPIIGGSYIVFFKEDKKKSIRHIYYIKPSRMNYQQSIN